MDCLEGTMTWTERFIFAGGVIGFVVVAHLLLLASDWLDRQELFARRRGGPLASTRPRAALGVRVAPADTQHPKGIHR
jgi:hypothetical protein